MSLQKIMASHRGQWVALHHRRDEVLASAEELEALHRELERLDVRAVRVFYAAAEGEPEAILRP